ncbi:MAG TPA: YdcH family protein [Candidatus Acidoferrales bacterium]|nr:YdcH family protein [Candidatus Acidoferrales bacterium]
MPISPQELREQLLASDAEFQRLAQEHSRYEDQLEQLSKAPYLSSEDIIQQTTLKKLKLCVKDEMERLIARHRKRGAGS